MTATAVAAPVAGTVTPDERGSNLLTSTVQVAKRALLTFVRSPQLVVLSTVQMAVFLVGFRFVFGGAIESSNGVPYADFGVPGFVAAGVLYSTVATATAMAQDLQSGLIDRFRSLPMPRATVLTGRVLADVAVLAWSLAFTTAIGFLIGFRLHGTVLQGLEAFGLCLVYGFAFSWVFIALGLLVRTAQAAQGLIMLVFMLSFVSNAYVPANTMPGWLRGFAEHQPISYMVDSVRALTLGPQGEALLGHPASYFIVRALLWSAGIFVVFGGLAVALFRRR